MKNRIILFGGTFDPIHLGHVRAAEAAQQYLDAERVIFIPARRSPCKPEPPSASEEDRLRMVQLAIEGHEGFEVSDCEFHRPPPSYTVETVQEFRERLGSEADLFWLLGADAVKDLPRWYQIDRLMELCRIAVMYRAGYPKPGFSLCKPYFTAEQIRSLEENVVPVPLVDISSSEIRRRLACGQDASDRVPAPAAEYIRRRRLYGCGS